MKLFGKMIDWAFVALWIAWMGVQRRRLFWYLLVGLGECSMRYKVRTQLTDVYGEFEEISGWVEADSLLDAAAVFMLDRPTDEIATAEYLDPVLVVSEDYVLGNYSHECVRIGMDYAVGLRELSQD